MTIPAFAEEIGARLPSASEKVAANQLRQIIAAHVDGGKTLRLLDDDRQLVDVTLTPALSQLLLDLLGHIERGDAVTLVPGRQMLSTQQAAGILNVSRPHLISLLEKEAIPHVLVGRHRRSVPKTCSPTSGRASHVAALRWPISQRMTRRSCRVDFH